MNQIETLVVTARAMGSVDVASKRLLESLDAQLHGREPVLTLVFASMKQPLIELLPILRMGIPHGVLLGASTAGEFTEQGDTSDHVVLVAICGDMIVQAGTSDGLRQGPEKAVSRALASIAPAVTGYPHRTGILLLDALAGTGEEAALITGGMLGPDVRLAGGASGDGLQMKTTWVGCGAHAADNSLVIAVIHSKSPLGVGVCHGHRPASDPITVTSSEGNTVRTLDGRPAWEVYREKVRGLLPKDATDPNDLSADALGGLLLTYEAGLANGEEYKIRAPLTRNSDNSIGFACGIPEGSVIRITESTPERQVDSARIAAERALASIGGGAQAGAIVFDCICRRLILGTTFDDAIGGISKTLGGVPIAGFETYGEIALDVGDMSGFHNTTTVVLTFPRR